MAADDNEQVDTEEQIAGPALMAERIASARREAGYRTAQDFAEALVVSVWTVRSWECAKSQPRYDVLREISRLTAQPIAWFLGENPAQDDPGVYGIGPFDRAAERELNALSEDARGWGVLLRLRAATAPATAEQIAALHVALAGLARRESEDRTAD